MYPTASHTVNREDGDGDTHWPRIRRTEGDAAVGDVRRDAQALFLICLTVPRREV